MNIRLLNKIAQKGLDNFSDNYEYGETIENEDGILVRSTVLHDYNFPAQLKAIARAGAGVNNIPIDKCSDLGIAVFNTPGANANAVKELTVCGILLSSRKITDGIEWAKTVKGEDYAKQIEKGKSAYVGPEIAGKKLGVIGLGAIGVNVANAGVHLNMDVLGYDPYISVNSAWMMSKWVKHASNISEIFVEADYITLHAPATKETKGVINKNNIQLMKDGVRIINFARADLVVEEDVIAALESGKIACYVTDFGSEELVKQPNAIVLPHLGASTPESEENCAVMAVKELTEYLETGNISNSVNLPAVNEPIVSKYRICIIHRNVPNMLAQFATIVANNAINIENMTNKAKGDLAYTLIDTNTAIDANAFADVENVIKVRIIEF